MEDKMTTKELIQYYIDHKNTPIGIKCHKNQNWNQYFNEPVVIDASTITFEELFGTDYQKRTYFEPIWYKDLLNKKVLVINNLDMITPKDDELTDDLDVSDYGEKHPGQISFMFLCRNSNETDNYRKLNDTYIIPSDVTVFIIMKNESKYSIIENISSRCYGIINIIENNI
jgi:DNA polymerase III delta prime subunit